MTEVQRLRHKMQVSASNVERMTQRLEASFRQLSDAQLVAEQSSAALELTKHRLEEADRKIDVLQNALTLRNETLHTMVEEVARSRDLGTA
jgi:hypothetical protein